MSGSPERDRYLELRRQGVPQWQAFGQAAEGRRSVDTASVWERWFRAEQGLPRREPDPRVNPR